MKVYCSSCGSEVPVADVVLDRLLAKCVKCNVVFDISAQLGSPASDGSRSKARRRAAVPMPARIRVLEDSREEGQLGESYRVLAASVGPRLTVERRWFNPGSIALLVFALFWDGFLVVFLGAIASSKHPPILAFLFPLGHVAAGAFITYTALTGLINKTLISVADGILSVKHGPIPAFGNLSMPTEDLSQIYTQLVVGSKGSRSYNLNAVSKSGAEVKLLKALPEPEQALYLEQLLESRLGITDVAVEGEYQAGT